MWRCFHAGWSPGAHKCSRFTPGNTDGDDQEPTILHVTAQTKGQKNLPTSLKQLQPKCKPSDNRWDQTDGGTEWKKGGNIRDHDRQGSQYTDSLAIVKFFCRHHMLRLYLESYRFYAWFFGKWAGTHCQLRSILEMRLVFKSIQVIFSLLFLWKVKHVSAKSWALLHRVNLNISISIHGATPD